MSANQSPVNKSTNPPRPFHYAPPQEALDIIHEDNFIIIVKKPAGLLSVPGKADHHKDCLETRLKAIIPDARTVHRLDMATSGLMIFAKSPQAHRHLGLQFEKRYVKKTYQARVSGQVSGQSGYINLPIITDWPNRPLQKICFQHGRAAQTHWRVTERYDNFTDVELYPITGRSHQLRLHMKSLDFIKEHHLGHPILGDALYAHEHAYNAAPRLMLHASRIEFFHPEDGRSMVFLAPQDFHKWL